MLLLSGAGLTHRTWTRVQIPYLCRRFRTLALDYRGLGGSEVAPGRYSVRQFAADALGLLAALGVERAHLIGHSMGASVAMAAAALAAGQVRSLTLVSPGGHLDPDRSTPRGIPVPLVLDLVQHGYPQALRAQFLSPFWFPPAYRDQHPERVHELADLLVADLPPLAMFLKHVEAGQQFETIPCAERLRVPALIIAGAEETMARGSIPHLEAANRLHRLVPGAEIRVIPGTAHGLLWQAPELINATLEQFVSGQ